MSINFNGTTSKLEHITANLLITTTYTICAHVFADGRGEQSVGRIISLPEAANRTSLRHANGDNTLKLDGTWGTTPGEWTFPATDGQWNAVAISYNAGSDANDPVARVNYTNVTVTETLTPSGTWTTPATGYCVGNNTAQTTTWDGMIKHLQVFNVILANGEMDQALRRPGSVRRGLKLWLPMLHAGYVVDWSGNGFNATNTDLTDRAGGPLTAPLYYTEGRLGLSVVFSGGGNNQKLLYGVGG